MASGPQTLYLCGAPQSSGSSLISWCFLQRGDTDGVLDARNDLLPEMPPVRTPNAWCKFTISSFRLLDAAKHLEDNGWQVRPLLVLRDPRAVFNSLITKPYGRNGITAEDPPLRLRLRRVHRDWQSARELGWPVMRYESFVERPEAALREACEQLGLPWDPAMLTWPKTREQIAEPGHGSKTFRATRGGSLADTLRGELCQIGTDHIPSDDLRWLEEEFADLINAMNYPPHADSGPCPQGRAVPTYELTRRARRNRPPLVRLRDGIRKQWARWRGRGAQAVGVALCAGAHLPLAAGVPC
jgi:hypothetical protein